MSQTGATPSALITRGRIVAYGAVGLSAALVFIVVTRLAQAGGGLQLVPAAAVGFSASFVLSYFGHRWLTFRSAGAKAAEIPRFLVTSLMCFGLTLGCTHVFASRFGLSDLAALALTSAIVPVLNFLLMAVFVFVRRDTARRR
jgi:putative flippase GtrA